MRTISVSQPARGIAGGLLLSLVVVLLTGTASAGISIPLQGSSLAPSGRDYTPLSIKSGGQYRQEPTGDTAVLAGKYVDRTATIPRIDATALGIGPLTGAPPDGMIPDSGAIGKGGAFVSLAPDMIPANIPYDIGIVATSFQPNESLAIKINGIPGSTGTADANGRLATVLTVQGNGSLGYFTFDALGLSSGREGAGVVLLSPTLGAFPPGLAVAPHAINRTGNFITLVGANFPSNAAITITADGTVIATTTSDASGAFGGEIPLTSGVPTSRVVSAYASSGMRVGQSVELRNDAGPPPLGDQNMVWAMVDRALLGTAPHIFGIVGEGFLPGEPVHIVACPQFLIGTAAGDGSVGFLLPTGAGSGFNDCLLTGQSSGRIAHVSIGGASNGLNLPGMIAAPASLLNTGGGTGQALLTRLIPNQSGTLYLDGTSLGSVSSGATGSVSVPFPKPTSGFLHTLSWIGTGGQAVAAPILYWPAAGTSTPTPTITRTSTPTYTPTRTPTGTNTPTITPTRPPCGYRILVAHADTVPPVTLRNALLADNRVNSVDLFNAGAGTPTLAQLQQYQIVVTYSNLGYLDPHALGNVLADYQDGGGVVVAGFGSFLEATSIGGRWRTGGYSPYDFGFNIVSNAVTLGSHNPAHPLLQGVTTLNAGARAANSVSAGATQVAAYSDTSPAVAFKSTSGHTALGITVYLGEAGNGGSGDYAKLIVNAGSWLWPGGSCSTPTPVPTSTLTPTTTHTHTHTPTPTHTSTRTSTPSNTPTHTRTNTPLPTQTPGGPSATPIPTNTNTPTHTNTPSNTPSNTRTSTPSNTPSNTPTHTRTNTPLPTHTPGGPSATPIPTNTNASTGTPTNTSVVSTPTSQSGGTATSTTPALATATPASCALEFADVPPDHTFYANIRCLACRGIISGYACGGPGEPCNQSNDPYFRPANLVTRGQIAKIVSNAAGFIEPHSEQSFEDVPPASTFHEFVERLASRGVMGGYVCGGAGEPCVPPGNLPYFRPNVTATRGQLAKIVANAAGLGGPVSGQMFEDAPPTHTFYEFIERLIALGVMGGYACGEPGEPCVPPDNRPYFRPADSVTRGQTTKIVSNTFYPGCQTPRR